MSVRRFFSVLPTGPSSACIAALTILALGGCAVPQKKVDNVELQRQLGNAIARCVLPAMAGQNLSLNHIKIWYSYHHGELTLRSNDLPLKQKILDCLPPLAAIPIDLQGNVEIWPAP